MLISIIDSSVSRLNHVKRQKTDITTSQIQKRTCTNVQSPKDIQV